MMNIVEHDDQYLFRLASTFGWDELIDLCSSLRRHAGTASSPSGGRCTNEDDDDDDDEQRYYKDGLSVGGGGGRAAWATCAARQAKYVDQWGNSPLHAALYVKPPVDVVEALLATGRAALGPGEVPLWATPTKDGSTPLLVACSTGASAAVVHRLLDELQRFADGAAKPHARSARLLVLQPDLLGNTPLAGWMAFHAAWIRRQLRRSAPPHLPEQALLSLADCWRLACRLLLFAAMHVYSHDVPRTDKHANLATTRTASPGSPAITQSVTSPARITNQSPTLIHRCAAISPYCPIALMDWMSDRRYYIPPSTLGTQDITQKCTRADNHHQTHTWNPGNACASTTDPDGKLPLHRAIEAQVHPLSSFLSFRPSQPTTTMTPTESYDYAHGHDCSAKFESNRVQILERLLEWNPDAARTPLPKIHGKRSPLCHAIGCGLTWHGTYSSSVANGGSSTTVRGIGDDCVGRHDNHVTNNMGPVQLLWKYAPEMTLEIDPVTKLYPFMLAATLSSSPLLQSTTQTNDDDEDDNNNNNDEKNNKHTKEPKDNERERISHECQVMETIYNLLRKEPQLVGSVYFE